MSTSEDLVPVLLIIPLGSFSLASVAFVVATARGAASSVSSLAQFLSLVSDLTLSAW